jgi:diguanylate cyclase (GGDEF)-like protein/PAS domain S-box-containing protein
MHGNTTWLARLAERVRPRAVRPRDEAAESLRLMAERCGDVVFRFGADGKARYISPSVERLFGCSRSEIYAMGGDVASNGFVHVADVPMGVQAVRQHFAGELPEVKLEFRIVRRDGAIVWVQTNCSTITDAAGTPTDIIFTMRDIGEKKALEAELEALARTDALTGLANRRAFDEALDAEWRRAARDGSPLSLVLLDVDHFKPFNDANGHQAGDDCLRTIARAVLQAARRAGETAARYGGEEFALVLPATDSKAAAALAEQIRGAVEGLRIPHPLNPDGKVVTVSIGLATALAADGASLKMPYGLLEAADRALYKAKSGGRNRVERGVLLTPAPSLQKAS